MVQGLASLDPDLLQVYVARGRYIQKRRVFKSLNLTTHECALTKHIPNHSWILLPVGNVLSSFLGGVEAEASLGLFQLKDEIVSLGSGTFVFNGEPDSEGTCRPKQRPGDSQR